MPDDDDRLWRLEARRLEAHQALMDARLLALERNLLFRWWSAGYRAAASLYARFGSDERYGGLSDLRTPGDYARWMNRQQLEMEVRPELRSQPLISIVTSEQVVQSYSRYECVESAAAAKGDYVITLHPGDRLSPHALYFYAQALADGSPDLVYADEEVGGAPLFKPGWSPELALGRGVLYRRGVSEAASGVHVARVLYNSVEKAQTKVCVTRAGTGAGTGAGAGAGGRISVIVCSRDLGRLRKCLKAVRATASVELELVVVHHVDGDSVELPGTTYIPYRGPFDFARMNNLAVEKATAPYLLFLNDDVIVKERGWDSRLVAALARVYIGVAGPILEYPNGTIQHAGVVTGMGDGAGHCGRFQRGSELWPWLRMSRDVSAVTGAMLGMRSDVFRRLQGFDPQFPVNYNDVDMCLRVKQAGLRVLCLDLGKIIHYESQTRVACTQYAERDRLYNKWSAILARPDEFYSPHLAPTERIALDSGAQRPLSLLGSER
jgi:hypothetical protein